MTAATQSSIAASAREPGLPSSPRGWSLAGLSWVGFAIVAIASTINATRRTINSLPGNHFFEWLLSWGEVFATGFFIGAAILVAVVVIVNRHPEAGRRQYVAVAMAVLASTAIACLGVIGVETRGTFTHEDHYGGRLDFVAMFLTGVLRYSVLGGLIAGAYLFLRAEHEDATAAHDCDVDAARLDEQSAQAQLQVLEAQIEPHFLFNALATVRRLFQTEPATAERMLDNMMRYLAIALPQMRAGDSTLGREAALAEAYLNIQKIRMGRRLDYRISVPADLRDAVLPSLMLPTLVENAIKHGIGPLPAGGSIEIVARASGDRLEVVVADTGRGFVESSGGGTGLANIRARLAAKYGTTGRLELAVSAPHGVRFTLSLPLSRIAGDVPE